MAFQPKLFLNDLHGVPRYLMNSEFHNLGTIINIEEMQEPNGEFYYRYRIGNSLYGELVLINYEIESCVLHIDHLDSRTKELYKINFESKTV